MNKQAHVFEVFVTFVLTSQSLYLIDTKRHLENKTQITQ